MDDTAATIDRLTAERDAALRRVANLERAIRDPFEAARAITRDVLARYLTATGWTPAVAPFWTKPGHQPTYVHPGDPLITLRDIRGPLAINLADALEHANAAR